MVAKLSIPIRAIILRVVRVNIVASGSSLASNAKVISMEKDWIEIRNEYKAMADAIKGFEDAVGKFKTEIDDLWKGLDAASSPLG